MKLLILLFILFLSVPCWANPCLDFTTGTGSKDQKIKYPFNTKCICREVICVEGRIYYIYT